MKPSKLNVESLLSEIHAEITSLKEEEDFKHMLQEDIELAMECFKEKNILSVINCLGVLVDKLQTRVILSCCHYSVIEKLLLYIQRLQQILIRLPVCISGPTGPIGPAGATGPTGPAGSTTLITSSSFPVSSIPNPMQTAAKSGYFDSSTHVVIYDKLIRNR